jgi:hypothetical protein
VFPALGPVLTPLAYLALLAVLGLAVYWVTRLALAPRSWCTRCARRRLTARTVQLPPRGKVAVLCRRCRRRLARC